MGVPGLGTPQAGLQQQGQVPEGPLQWSREDQQHHGQGGSTRDTGVYQGFCPRKSGRCQGTRFVGYFFIFLANFWLSFVAIPQSKHCNNFPW